MQIYLIYKQFNLCLKLEACGIVYETNKQTNNQTDRQTDGQLKSYSFLSISFYCTFVWLPADFSINTDVLINIYPKPAPTSIDKRPLHTRHFSAR